MLVLAGRVGMQFLIDRTVERLRGDRLWEHLVDHVMAVATRPATLFLILFLVLVPRRRGAVGWLRFVGCAAFCLVLLSGWPDGEIQYRPGWWSIKGRLGWGAIGVLTVIVSMVDHYLAAPRRLLRSQLVTRFSLTALALLAGGFFFLGASLVVDHRRVVLVREVTLPDHDLLQRFQRDELQKTGNIEVGSILAGRGAEAGGSRPSLIVPPGASVEFEVRPGSQHHLRFGYGVNLAANRGSFDKKLKVTFLVTLDGKRIFRDRLSPADEGDQRWFEEDLQLEDRSGETATLSFAVEASDDAVPALRAGFSLPRIVHTQRLPRQPASGRDWNLVVIVLDSLRRDHVGAYGYSRDTTPQLDRFAEECLVYDQANTVAPWARPSVATLMTGLYPPSHGVISKEQGFLSDSLVTLAEVLQSHGVTTAGWTANHLVSRKKNFHQGFEIWREFPFRSGKLVNREFLDFVARFRDYQFFTYLHFAETRAPYYPPEGFRGRFGSTDLSVNDELMEQATGESTGSLLRDWSAQDRQQLIDLYDSEIAAADAEVGRCFKILKDHDLWSRTIVIVTSSQGQEFFEHGGLTHGRTLHGESLNVPLLVRVPRQDPGRVTDPVDVSRVAATALTAMGFPPGRFRSLPLPPWGKEGTLAYAHLSGNAFSEASEQVQWSVQDDEWKLILSADGGQQLYAVGDRLEAEDLAESRPQVVESLARRIRGWLQGCERSAVEAPRERQDSLLRRRAFPVGEEPGERPEGTRRSADRG